MKIVLTGGLGHIGSGFLQRATELLPGAHIVVIDNLQTQRYCSLFNLPKSLSHEFIEGDVRNMDLNPHVADADAVIHLGATTDAAGTAHDPNLIFRNNLPGTQAIINACIKNAVPLLFPSSTSVYGVQDGLVDEDCAALKPQSPYADCKIKEEALIRSHDTKRLKFCIARFGTIFGVSAGMRFHTAVNKFCWQASMGQPITVWRTAMDQKRPYLGLGDACGFMAFAIKNRAFGDYLYNVVTENFTVRGVVDTIREFVPGLEVKLVDNAIMNQLSYEVSNERLRRAGFTATDSLKDNIRETIRLLRPAEKAA
ncbi:MAG: SDR family oxidoreductase [Proteobacteria bacterium]|nr:SDR family oxidoreductase [Pseudomonadota bacterium]